MRRVLIVCDSKDEAEKWEHKSSLRVGIINNREDANKWGGYNFRFINYTYDAPKEVREYLECLIRWVP
jgi:hypothetical protein